MRKTQIAAQRDEQGTKREREGQSERDEGRRKRADAAWADPRSG